MNTKVISAIELLNSILPLATRQTGRLNMSIDLPDNTDMLVFGLRDAVDSAVGIFAPRISGQAS